MGFFDRKKPSANRGDTVRPKPETLGTGAAANAAKKAVGRNQKICEASGGRWNAAKNRCE